MTALAGQDQPKAQASGAACRQGHRLRPNRGPSHRLRRKSRQDRRRASSVPPAKKSSATKSPIAPAPRSDVDVRVRTKAEMAKPKSPFLLAPDGSPEDRYGPDGAVDWSDVPPWRQTSFFGIRARASSSCTSSTVPGA